MPASPHTPSSISCFWCDAKPAPYFVITGSIWTEDREVERATYARMCDECSKLPATKLTSNVTEPLTDE
jgi:hypothetical protein